jgi:type IV pilus assembly protein PilB
MSGKLGDILIQQAVIDEQKLIAALADQRAFGGKLGRTLVDLGYVTEEQLVQALATQLGLTTIDLQDVEPGPEALACLPADACKRYGVFPIRVDPAQRLLWVATAEPEREPLAEVARIARHTLEPVLCTMSSIDRAIKRFYRAEGAPARGPLNEPSRETAPIDEPWEEGEADLVESSELASGSVAVPEGAFGENEDVRTILLRLEKTVVAQGKSFRALVELLQEKGLLRRGELGTRASRKP